MISTFGIKNYRNLNNLQLKSLGRINLITGKNNTGKSALLEAISIYTTKADISWIVSLLQERGEYYRNSNNSDPVEMNLKTFSSLFCGRKISFFDVYSAIQIGQLEDNLFGSEISSTSMTIRIIKFFEEIIKQPNLENEERIITRRKKTIIDEKEDKSYTDSQIGIEIKGKDFYSILPLDSDRPYRLLNYHQNKISENIQYIRTRNIESELNGRLWDNIALSTKEEFLIRALKIIEPNIERLTFINNTTTARQERIPVIKLKNEPNIIPLKSMGDGINRILTIILALINSDNGYLLIDEVENGLHYTVQEKLWNIIFDLAKELNVQIFATTHSLDCIKSFEKVLNSQNDFNDCKLIRLDIINNLIKQVEYDANELKVASNQEIEIR